MITRRVYIDSRNAASGNTQNFLYELPEDLVLPRDDCACYITDVSLPYAFHTIDTHNQHLYLYERASAAAPAVARQITLTAQQYDVVTLAAELQTRLNTGKSVTGVYSVALNSGRNTYTISLTLGNSFMLIPDEALLADQATWTAANGPALPKPLASIAGVLGLPVWGSFAWSATHETGHLDVRGGTHTLYLHSSTLGNYNTIGPSFCKSVLLRIPVTVGFGDVIRMQHSGLVHDYIDCGGQTLRTLQFSLRDGFNRPVDLHGGNLSFTLLFTQKPVI